MKKLFLITLLLAAFILPSFAQQVSREQQSVNEHATSLVDKYLNNIPVRAMRDFLERYTDSGDIHWYAVKNAFVAICKQDSVTNRIVYNHTGRWVYTLKWYKENKLPKQVRALVRSTWYDYAITQVEELQQSGEPVVYVVHLEDADTWKNVSVCELQLKEIATYNKQKIPVAK
jgi:hypothetical protein